MMGAQNEKGQSLSPETEIGKVSERDDDEDIQEEKDEDVEDTPTEKLKSHPRHMFQRKWLMFFFSICLVGAFVGLGSRFAPQYLPKWQNKIVVAPSEPIKDNMREETIDPFFIPLPPWASREVIRVDLSVVLDGLAYFRYLKNDVLARDQLYNYLMEKAKIDQDLSIQISILEMEMGGILKETLDVNDVLIRIREVKTF